MGKIGNGKKKLTFDREKRGNGDEEFTFVTLLIRGDKPNIMGINSF